MTDMKGSGRILGICVIQRRSGRSLKFGFIGVRVGGSWNWFRSFIGFMPPYL